MERPSVKELKITGSVVVKWNGISFTILPGSVVKLPMEEWDKAFPPAKPEPLPEEKPKMPYRNPSPTGLG